MSAERDVKADLPFVSIIVPVLDRVRMIGTLLDSLAALDYPRDRFEIIVVDNGSLDGTAQAVARYPVRLLEERRVRSSYAARNRGIEASRGDLLAFTDSDCVAAPGWLSALVAGWEDERFGAFAGEVVAHDPRGLVERFLGQRRVGHRATLEHPYLPFVTTSNVAYRRRVVELIGPFDPRLRSGGDVDLSWRMQQATRYRIAYRPDALVFHKNRASVRELYRQYRLYGEGMADLERLHADLYTRFSHRYGLPRARAGARFVRRHTLEDRPGWMRPTSRLESVGMWCLDGIVKIAFDQGIRRGRRRHGGLPVAAATPAPGGPPVAIEDDGARVSGAG